MPDEAQRLRLEQVHFEPQQVERFDRLGDAAQPLGFVVEVEVEQEPHAFAGALAQGGELIDQCGQHVLGEVELGMTGAGADHAGGNETAALVIEQQHVGFERLEAALARLARGGLEVIERAHCRPVDDLAVEKLGTARAQDAAARPVDRHVVAHRAAEKLVDRDTQRFAADVEARILDCRDGVRREPARR